MLFPFGCGILPFADAGLVYRYYPSFPSWRGGFDSRTLLHAENPESPCQSGSFGVFFISGAVKGTGMSGGGGRRAGADPDGTGQDGGALQPVKTTDMEGIAMALPAEKTHFTYSDYLEWDGPERFELIEGVPYLMASPSDVHQEIVVELSRQLANFLFGKKCRLFTAPFDVRLFERNGESPDDVDTIVQPDLLVVCDSTKIDRKGVHGAPDLVIEVLSPGTARHDRLIKLNQYQAAGVREYWLVSPEEQTVQVSLLDGGILRPTEVYNRDGIAKVITLDGCFIELEKVFRA